MLGFEPRASGVGRDRFANCATTTAPCGCCFSHNNGLFPPFNAPNTLGSPTLLLRVVCCHQVNPVS